MTLIDQDRVTYESKSGESPSCRMSVFQHGGVDGGRSRTVARVWEGPPSEGRHLFQASTLNIKTSSTPGLIVALIKHQEVIVAEQDVPDRLLQELKRAGAAYIKALEATGGR